VEYIYNLGFALLCNTSDNLLDFNKGHMQPIIGMVGVWKMEIFVLFMLLCKCNHICDKLKTSCSRLSPNVISTTYIIMKTSHNILCICCMKFVSLYNRCSTVIVLANNYIVSSIKLFMINVVESCIV
jgi:hypothetical protein